MNERQKIVAICGVSGFVGSNLCTYLKSLGWEVVSLGRELFDEEAGERLREVVSSCDAVICVAGATIDHRWSASYKRLLYESRVGVVRKLVDAMNSSQRVHTFISASAVGYYAISGCHDEESGQSGDDFLAKLCRAWEEEACKAPTRIRTLITRFGVVLASHGGAFGRMSRPARLGVGTIIGSGRQPFTWIDLDDLCRGMGFLLDSDLSGIFNFVAPQQLSQREIGELISLRYGARVTLRIPALFFRLIWGEAADFLLNGQCVIPRRLLEAGFEFRSPDLRSFLNRLND